MGRPGLKPGQKALVGAGRKKGTLNRGTVELRSAIAAVCGDDWDPVVSMAKIAKDGVIPTLNTQTGEYIDLPVGEKTRTTCFKEVSEYIHAKRKAIEVTGADGGPIEMVNNDVRAVATLGAMMSTLDDSTE